MKKYLSLIFAAALAIGAASSAAAAAAYEGGALANTVTGFRGGHVSWQRNLTQMGGPTSVEFDLGSNAAYYEVEIDVNKGEKYVSAAFDRENSALVVTPDPSAPKADNTEYEVEIDVVDRKTGELVAGDYYLTGFLSYDDVQEVVSGRFYNNARGVLYDFGRGARDVKINAGGGVSVTMPKTPAGVVDLRVTKERNKAVDYMFSKHELEYVNFAANPVFPQEAEIQINSPAPYLYEYAGGVLRKVPGARFTAGEGYTVWTRRPAVYILANAPLTEGRVNEEKYTVTPAGAGYGSSSTVEPEYKPEQSIPNTGKPNPSTGAGR